MIKRRILDRIIDIIREEMMVANAAGSGGGFSSSADPKGPVAGFDPKLKKRYIWTRGIRKNWKPKNES